MIDLTKLPAADAERIAYAEGFTGTAALFARIAELERLLRLAVADVDPYNTHPYAILPEWVKDAREVLK